MCGINGFNFADKKILGRMSKVLEYRGPDDTGNYIDGNVSLNQKRLSIIDLTPGLYPIHNEKGSIQFIYNGEVYNYKGINEELERKGHKFYTSCDAETIVHSYEEWGVDCLKKFNGMFAFCLYDSDKKLLFLARDRVGIKPLFYFFDGEKFIFSSELKGILEHQVKREVNADALNRFITMRYISGEDTIFKCIKRLPAGHYMILDLKGKTLKIRKYWDLKVDYTLEGKGEGFFVEHVSKLLRESVERRLLSHVPLGAYLSGGVDSSAIVGMMSLLKQEQEDNAPIRTFSVAFEHGEKVNELDKAKNVSEFFEAEHTEFMIKTDVVDILPRLVWHFDEPFADPAAIPVYELSRMARKSITVALTGDGGDELFAGYDQYRFLKIWEKTRKLPNVISGRAMPFMLKKLPKPILDKIYKYSSDMGEKAMERVGKLLAAKDGARAYQELVSIFDEDERRELFEPGFAKTIKEFTNYERLDKEYFSDGTGIVNQAEHFDTKVLLPECFLVKSDRMIMARSIEGRVPMLDHELVEFAFKIPNEFKLRGQQTKYVLKKALHNLLPKEVLERGKQTFHVPMDQWIERDLKHKFEELLSKRNVEAHGYFKYDTVEKIFRNYPGSKLFYARQLWNLANFQLWHKIFIEGIKIKDAM